MVIIFSSTHVISAFKDVSSIITNNEVYSMQQMMKYVQSLLVDLWLSTNTVSSTNKTDCHEITDILLYVALEDPNPKSTN